MRKILLILAIITSFAVAGQTPFPLYIPANPDSLRIPVNLNGATRTVYNIDLVKYRAAIAAHDTATALRLLISSAVDSSAYRSSTPLPANLGTGYTLNRLNNKSDTFRYNIPAQFNPVAGTNMTITGTYPNMTFNSTASGGSSQWTTFNSNDIYYNTGNVNIGSTNTGVGKLNIATSGLGTANDPSNGLVLTNTTPATSSVLQNSPILRLTGNSWNSSSSRSDSASILMYAVAKNASNTTTPDFVIQGKFDGNAPITLGTFSGGSLTGSGNITMTGTGGTNNLSAPLYLANTTTGRFIDFYNNNTLQTVIGSENTTGNLHIRVNNAGSLTGGNAVMVFGQKTGNTVIGSSTLDGSAVLRLDDVTKGFLPPRMTTTQRDSINLTITGVVVDAAGTGYTQGTTFITVGAALYGETAGTYNTVTVSSGAVSTATVATAGSYSRTPPLTVSGTGTGAIVHAVMTQVLPEGLIIYNLTTHKSEQWNGTIWNALY